MTTATLEIYRTESGAMYEVAGTRIRRTASRGGAAPMEGWQEYRSISRVPASLLSPGDDGEVLEVVLTTGKRILTSRLVHPFALDTDAR